MQKCGNSMKLLNRFVRHFGKTFNPLLNVTFPCRSSTLWCLSGIFLKFWHLYLLLISFENKCVSPWQLRYWQVLIVEDIQSIPDQWVVTGSSKSAFFCNVCTRLRHVLSFSCHLLCRQHTLTRNNYTIWRWRKRHSHPLTFSHPSSLRTFPNFWVPYKSSQKIALPAELLDRQLSANVVVFLLGNLIQIFGQSSSERWRKFSFVFHFDLRVYHFACPKTAK